MAKEEKVKAKTKVKAKSGKTGHHIDILKLKNINQLRGASYNPRMITDRRLSDLEKSLGTFGDLSGVVFNNSVKSGVLISGHQRLTSIKGWTTKVEVNPFKDSHGTVGIGYIYATSPKGKEIQIPLRVVDWADRKAEYAANIAANAHGGEFDNKKLAVLVEKLDMTRIPPAIMGLDPLQLRGLQQRLAKQGQELPASTRNTGTQNGSSGAFNEATVDDMEAEVTCKCPRCGFRF